MNTHADKTPDNSSSASRQEKQSITDPLSQKEITSKSPFHFVDNRPQVIAQCKIQEIGNNHPQMLQLKAIQEMADNYSAQHYNPIQKEDDKLLQLFSPESLTPLAVFPVIQLARMQVKSRGDKLNVLDNSFLPMTVPISFTEMSFDSAATDNVKIVNGKKWSWALD